MVIRYGGYTLVNPYGIYQSALMQSNTSSQIAYATTGPSHWIANGSNGIWNFAKGVGRVFS